MRKSVLMWILFLAVFIISPADVDAGMDLTSRMIELDSLTASGLVIETNMPTFSSPSDGSGLPQMFERGSYLFLSTLFGSPWAIVLLLIILFTVLFYYLFNLGLSKVPHFNNTDNVKSMTNKIAKILALIASSGFFGFPAITDGPDAVVTNVVSILNTTRLIAVWGTAVLMGALVYFTTKKNDPRGPHEHDSKGRWPMVLTTIFFTLFVGYGLLGFSGTAMTFFVLAAVPLVYMIIPKALPSFPASGRTGGGSNGGSGNHGGTSSPSNTGAGTATPPGGSTGNPGDHSNTENHTPADDAQDAAGVDESELRKKENEFIRDTKQLSVWDQFIIKYGQAEYDLLENHMFPAINNIEEQLGSQNPDYSSVKESWDDIKKFLKKSNWTHLLRAIRRSSRRMHRLVSDLKKKFEALENETGGDYVNHDLVMKSKEFLNRIDEIVYGLESERKNLRAAGIKTSNGKKIYDRLQKQLNGFSENKGLTDKKRKEMIDALSAFRNLMEDAKGVLQNVAQLAGVLRDYDVRLQYDIKQTYDGLERESRNRQQNGQ
ncbi:MAG: hypothetical protein ACLFTR_04300, partial [Candidatus Woesearchaeota archaeon]